MNNKRDLLELKKGNQKVLTALYVSHRNSFIVWSVKTYQCSPDTAKDAFQYAILHLYKNVQDNKLVELNAGIKAYLFAIGKNYLLKSFTKSKKYSNVPMEVLLEIKDEKDEANDFELKYEVVKEGLSLMGNPCQDLIIKSYLEQKNVSELTVEFGYKNNDVTKNQKYKCMERLRNFVKSKNI